MSVTNGLVVLDEGDVICWCFYLLHSLVFFIHDTRNGYDAYAVPYDNRLIAALLWEHIYTRADISNECFPTNLIPQVSNTFKNEIYTTVFGSFCFCLSKAYTMYKFLNYAIA